jgi:DNA-binding transcriptional LysR family regulator
MDRLSALAIFKSVVDNGGFARAAADLEVSCAKVTRAVQELEMLLGVQLLQRTTRRVALTTVGREVLSRAADLLDSYDALAALSSLSASEPSGSVRLVAPAAFSRRYLGPALADFMARYPKVWVDLRMRHGHIDVVNDEVDVMLCLRSDLRPSLIARRIGAAEVGLFAAPRYLAERGEPKHPHDLLHHNCLTCEDTAGGSGWKFRQRISAEAVEVPVKGAMRSSHADALVGAAVHGAGVVLLPVFMVEEAAARGALRRLLPDWTSEPLALHLAYHSRLNQPLCVRKLIDHLVQVLGDVPGAQETPPVAPRKPFSSVSAPRPAPNMPKAKELTFARLPHPREQLAAMRG